MNWLSHLLSPRAMSETCVAKEYLREGVLLRVTHGEPDSGRLKPATAVYLKQLAGAEALIEREDGLLWTWDSVYDELERAPQEVACLNLPPVAALRPSLVSMGSLIDPDFTVTFDGWEAPDGERLAGVSLSGAVAYVDDRTFLLPRVTFELVHRLVEFHAVHPRTELTNRKAWGSLRETALKSGARLDQFLFNTVILTPEKLKLAFDRAESGGVDVVTVEPWFEGAPKNWLSFFDNLSIQDLYNIPTADGIVQVICSEDVKHVLAGVKALPGRRVAGRFAEKFLANAIAALGEPASRVLDANQIEQAREHAGIRYQRFTAQLRTKADGEPEEVGLLIETAGSDGAESEYQVFRDAQDLAAFLNGVRTRLATKEETFRWRRYDLQLLGDTEREVETLLLAYRDWTKPRITIRFADVADLKRYSERVMGIGVQEPLVSPYLPKKQDSSWFPEEVEGAAPPVMVTLTDVKGGSHDVPVTPAVELQVSRRIDQAKAKGQSHIEWPETKQQVAIDVCVEAMSQVTDAWKDRPTTGKSPHSKHEFRSKERKELLLRGNIDSDQYKEQRAAALRFDAAREPKLPASLRRDVTLLPHQRVGVTWLQNLLEQAPTFCRGAVLADDMGLGKTLQLLTVIARRQEDDPSGLPALVVAPVALLENWKQEADRFFQPGSFRMLTLYGAELAARRESRSNIDAELISQGIDRFLRPGWVGDHSVVLTTYETLRDLEFSFAAQRWSIVICDEAQKIKNPAAMMTRAAKKQHAEFRIACTGTPVENTLIDLWCLFDWVQPGLLGSLNYFGKTYRRPIECKETEDRNRVEELRRLVECQILRRMKKDAASDLKAKVIDAAAMNLPMSQYQRRLYSKALEQFKNRKDRSRPTPFKDHLTLLQYLRLICTDPREYGTVFAAPEPLAEYRQKSPKLHWLIDTLKRIKNSNEKVIVFCEFRDIQRMLAHYIHEQFGFTPDIINGDTSASTEHSASRQKRIAAFQARPGFGAIILSPLAVGFGVNIQKANHVIHYTRTWNPAKEDQATDRAYRIGQEKDVYVYYPVVRADFVTFDQKLHDLLEQKRALSDDMLNGTGDVRPTDFEDVVGVGGDVFDERITPEDALQLEWRMFEALCAVLWKKSFRAVQLTPSTGDSGVDVVAWTQKTGELVQCKTCAIQGAELNPDAVKEVVAARPVYERRYPGIDFRLVCVTNQVFSASAHELARLHGVRLVEQSQLAELLTGHRITMIDLHRLLEADAVV